MLVVDEEEEEDVLGARPKDNPRNAATASWTVSSVNGVPRSMRS